MKKICCILMLILFSTILKAQTNFQKLTISKPTIPDTYTYSYTGAIQKFVVPNKVDSIQVNAIGAKGGTGSNGQLGGAGANITTTLDVTPGQILYIVVGGYPNQSATAKYGFGGDGGYASSGSGGAGGGLTGIFTSDSPANSNALVIAGGGGGGSGTTGTTNYNGGAALNSTTGSASNGQGSTNYPVGGRYQYGFGASTTSVGLGGLAFDNYPTQNGEPGNDLFGGDGGPGTIWQGAGGGGAGFYGGGGGAGGGSANGGGGGGASESTSAKTTFGTANTTGDGSLNITNIMSVPRIVDTSLVLNLDAGDSSSYSGSGTTWNDLSGNGSHVTLNSTTFDSANSGSIVFDGTTSYADFSASLGTTSVITVEMWVNTISLNGTMYFGFSIYDIWTRDGNIGFNTANGDLYGITSTQVNNLGIVGNWKQLVFVMNSGSKTNNKIYVNGIQQSLSQIYSTFRDSYATFNSGNGRISGWRNTLGYRMNKKLAAFRIYNRELTSEEIENNFNAIKSRFNL